MKTHIAAIGYNEKELETYVNQLRAQGFESLGEVRKSEDGSFYVSMAKRSKFETVLLQKTTPEAATALPA